MRQSGDALLAHVRDGGNDEGANKLLNEFFSGYPVENLRQLLHSDNEHAVKSGAWIASELGHRAEPLIDDIEKLLNHSSRYVRFFAIDAILGAGTMRHGQAIAKAVLTITDPDHAVRWKALNFLARASDSQLAAGLPFLRDSSEGRLTSWLLSFVTSSDTKQIRDALDGSDHLARMFAAAAAARVAVRDASALRYGAHSQAVEVRQFAEDELQARGLAK